MAAIPHVPKKLECLSLANISSQIEYLKGAPGAFSSKKKLKAASTWVSSRLYLKTFDKA
jgi:hypothetical protein